MNTLEKMGTPHLSKINGTSRNDLNSRIERELATMAEIYAKKYAGYDPECPAIIPSGLDDGDMASILLAEWDEDEQNAAYLHMIRWNGKSYASIQPSTYNWDEFWEEIEDADKAIHMILVLESELAYDEEIANNLDELRIDTEEQIRKAEERRKRDPGNWLF